MATTAAEKGGPAQPHSPWPEASSLTLAGYLDAAMRDAGPSVGRSRSGVPRCPSPPLRANHPPGAAARRAEDPALEKGGGPSEHAPALPNQTKGRAEPAARLARTGLGGPRP